MTPILGRAEESMSILQIIFGILPAGAANPFRQ
jgi:hypothetical protein